MILANYGIVSSSGGGIPFLLDTYSGARAAYSLRKLSTSYTGDAIIVRRSSDNTSQSIGFNGSGNLDTASLLSFVGAGNGFVSTWYDQSGNSQNGTQASSAYQPKIVNSGSLITDNGLPSVLFNNTDSYITFKLDRGVYSAFDSYFVKNSNSDSFYILPTFSGGYGYVAQSGSSSTDLYSNYNVSGNAASTRLYVNNALQSVTTRGSIYTALNGRKLELHSNMDIINSQTIKGINFGIFDASGLADYGGYLSEYIIFPNTIQSSNRTQISTDINSYYSIY